MPGQYTFALHTPSTHLPSCTSPASVEDFHRHVPVLWVIPPSHDRGQLGRYKSRWPLPSMEHDRAGGRERPVPEFALSSHNANPILSP